MRSPHAAHIVYFLFRQFKDSGNITLPHSRLLKQLTDYLEVVHGTVLDVLEDRPESYLTAWSSGDTRWLRRYLASTHSEAVYELTPHTEHVLKFLGEALDRGIGFVGTESRLRRIIETLSDIVVRGSGDPTRRLDHLRAERERINQEIGAIESGAAVSTYTSTAIRERFADAVSDLASLQGDFRAVEDCFKDITRDVQKRQAEPDGSRGEILGYALAAEDGLKLQDQGVSFDEFVRLILSPSKQDQLERIFSQLDEIEVLVDQVEGMRRIHGMIGSLSDEAEKVLRTTRRLSSTLRRLLDSRAKSSRLRLATVLREIRAVAVRLAESRPEASVGVEVLTELDLLNIWERPFWTAPTRFDAPELSDHEPDDDDRLAAFRHLAGLQRLDWETMRENVTSMLREASRISLPELIEAHPPAAGAVEVLGYVQIAHDDGHHIDNRVTETIRLGPLEADGAEPDPDDAELFDVPHVVFLSRELRSLDRGLALGGPG
ncbi:MAG TPA: DUF3375 family protein [Pirellulales bacterium]|nr:DUF3375 family protein [Pirellulales bacterium]